MNWFRYFILWSWDRRACLRHYHRRPRLYVRISCRRSRWLLKPKSFWKIQTSDDDVQDPCMDKAGPENRHAQYAVDHRVLACFCHITRNNVIQNFFFFGSNQIQIHRSALGKWANSMGSSLFMWGDLGRGVSLSIWSSSAFMPGLLWFNLYGKLLLLLLKPPTWKKPKIDRFSFKFITADLKNKN